MYIQAIYPFNTSECLANFKGGRGGVGHNIKTGNGMYKGKLETRITWLAKYHLPKSKVICLEREGTMTFDF